MLLDPLWLSAILSALAATLAAVAAFRPARAATDPLLADALEDLRRDLGLIRTGLDDGLARGRDEARGGARELREEMGAIGSRLDDGLSGTIARIGATQGEKLAALALEVKGVREASERRLAEMRRDAVEGGQSLREEVVRQLGALDEMLRRTLAEGAKLQGERLETGAVAQKERLEQVADHIRRLVQTNAEANESLRLTVEGRLETLRQDNAVKLEEMRRTVDEKLQGTLEERLGEKFKLVNDQLANVFKSVGEMQTLAQGVGDLKRVLTNVKSRGTWAEVSLGAVLEQILAPEQFVRNVAIRPGSDERVEYAVRLPGQGDDERGILLPIDAKFPIEDYERLLDASERGDALGAEVALKALETRIKLEGAKICEKYVSPPLTTDFGILYLPTEGLYAEVIRRPGLVDHLQSQCRIVVAGPTVLLAILNSLRMGFRTLAIQKRSGEVFQTLGAVKTEFAKYGDVLDKVRKKLGEASDQIDRVDVRRKAIDRKLRGVEALPEAEAGALLELAAPVRDADDLLDAAE